MSSLQKFILFLVCTHLCVLISTQIITQTGQIFQPVGSSGSVYPVNFPSAFASNPSVGISIVGLTQGSTGSVGVSVSVNAIYTTGFTFKVTYTVSVSFVEITYIATLSDQSKIYIYTNGISLSDPDLAATYNSWGSRTYSRLIPTPSGLSNPQRVVFLRGWAFSNTNTRLVLNMDNAGNVIYQPWDNSVLMAADTTIIVYDAAEYTTTRSFFAPGYTAAFNRDGSPKVTTTASVSFSNYRTAPQFFFGVAILDLGNWNQISWQENPSTGSNYFTISFYSDRYTAVYQALNNVLFTCQTAAKDCLCNDKFFASSPGACSACATQCATCTRTATTCTSCSSSYPYSFNGNCLSSCPNGYYPSSSTSCSACPSSCTSCTGPNTCTACTSGLAVQNSQCQTCPDGQYASNSQCLTCPNTCSICTNSNTCSACRAGYALKNSQCLACPDGQYAKDSVCYGCPNLCTKCTSPNVCTACQSGYGIVNSTCQVCADGLYASNSVCTGCPNTCTKCNASNSCSACKPGYGLVSGQCITCLDGTYLNNGLCSSCPTNCTRCTGPNTCTACQVGFGLVAGACSICPDGTYYNNGLCPGCPDTCARCSNATNCTACKTGYGILANSTANVPASGICMGCPDSTFLSNGKCLTCPFTCAKCSGLGNCSLCTAGYGLIDGLCVRCPNGTYLSNSYCPTCPRTCSKCTSNTTCTECSPGFGMVGTMCQTCPDGTFLANATCPSCPGTCEKCTSFNSCYDCKDGFGLVNGVCEICPAGTYLNVTSELCLNCPSSCAACSGPTRCTACNPGLGLINGACVICPNGTYLSNGLCPNCPTTCERCTAADTCTYCKITFGLLNSKCVTCPRGMFNSPDRVCTNCPSTCAACTGVGQCTECNFGFGMQNGTCITCPAGQCVFNLGCGPCPARNARLIDYNISAFSDDEHYIHDVHQFFSGYFSTFNANGIPPMCSDILTCFKQNDAYNYLYYLSSVANYISCLANNTFQFSPCVAQTQQMMQLSGKVSTAAVCWSRNSFMTGIYPAPGLVFTTTSALNNTVLMQKASAAIYNVTVAMFSQGDMSQNPKKDNLYSLAGQSLAAIMRSYIQPTSS